MPFNWCLKRTGSYVKKNPYQAHMLYVKRYQSWQFDVCSTIIKMKRIDLIRHLESSGCAFLREGHNHTMYMNMTTRSRAAIPRHREIRNELCKKICFQLEINAPLIK